MPLLELAYGVLRLEPVFGGAVLVPLVVSRWLPSIRNGALAALSAVLLALSGPDLNLWPLAFVAFIPFLVAIERARTVMSVLTVGLIAGASLVYLCFSWGPDAFANYCDTNRYAGFLLFAPFTVLLSLKVPVMSAILWHNNRTSRRLAPLICFPVAVGAVETFKWELYPWYFGLSLNGNETLSQMVDLVGMPGLSAFVALINVAILEAYRAVRTRRFSRFGWVFGMLLATVFAFFWYGQVRMKQVQAAEESGPELSVAVIQPNTPSRVLNADHELKQRIVLTLRKLVSDAVKVRQPDIMLFAESSAPMGFQAGYNPMFREMYESLAREHVTFLLTDNVHGEKHDGKWLLWRGALLLNPQGKSQVNT